MCAEATWEDFGSFCQRNNRGGSGEALRAVGQGGCVFWMGSWGRMELGNLFPSDRELCLVACCQHSQQEGRSKAPERGAEAVPGSLPRKGFPH